MARIKNIILSFIIVVAMVIAPNMSASANDGNCEDGVCIVTLCHPAGQSEKEITLFVSANSVPAHLAHGDTLGACPDGLDPLIEMCHRETITVMVSANSVAAHLSHGDTLGSCP